MYPNVHCSTMQRARTWKQPKCPSTEEWIKKMWGMCGGGGRGIVLGHKKD